MAIKEETLTRVQAACDKFMAELDAVMADDSETLILDQLNVIFLLAIGVYKSAMGGRALVMHDVSYLARRLADTAGTIEQVKQRDQQVLVFALMSSKERAEQALALLTASSPDVFALTNHPESKKPS